MSKQSIINAIIAIEGGYSNNAADSGGETMHGITKAVAVANGYLGSMKDIPYNVVFSIYSAKYWDSVKADIIEDLSPAIAEEIVDTGVHMGPLRAISMLQRALNALNSCSTLYPDIVVDGVVGSATIEALKSFLSKREEEVLLKALNVLQGAYYIELAERREKDERFVYGWLKNRVKV